MAADLVKGICWKEKNKKLKVTLKVLDHVASKYPDTKNHIEEKLKKVCEGEDLTVENVIYLIVYLCPLYFFF